MPEIIKHKNEFFKNYLAILSKTKSELQDKSALKT